jgi:hypothetical protein
MQNLRSILQEIVRTRLGIAPAKPHAAAQTRAISTPNAASRGWPDDVHAQPGILSSDETIRLLRHCRSRRAPGTRGPFPLACIAKVADISRETLHVALRAGAASQKTRAKLSPVLRQIAAGTIAFKRLGQKWHPIALYQPLEPQPPQAQPEPLQPKPHPPPQMPKIITCRLGNLIINVATGW